MERNSMANPFESLVTDLGRRLFVVETKLNRIHDDDPELARVLQRARNLRRWRRMIRQVLAARAETMAA